MANRCAFDCPGASRSIFVRDFPLFTEDYRTTLGQARRLEADLRVFEGGRWMRLAKCRASLALANRSLAESSEWRMAIRLNCAGRKMGRCSHLAAPDQASFCVNDPRNGESHTMSLDPDLAAADWSCAELASLEPSEELALASSGLDPVTGAQTMVLTPRRTRSTRHR